MFPRARGYEASSWQTRGEAARAVLDGSPRTWLVVLGPPMLESSFGVTSEDRRPIRLRDGCPPGTCRSSLTACNDCAAQ
jgi:hypothetical protein